MKIALTGNPNSGKTTLFNAITGKIEHVGNWPGVTIAKKEGKIKASLYKGGEDLLAVDLPGAYSMSPYTQEESITRDFVKMEAPDVIINVVDATNLSRSLFFTSQLLELDIPVIVALNKHDLSEKIRNKIDVEKLSRLLNCPVVVTVATKGKNNGLDQLVKESVALVKAGKKEAPWQLEDVSKAGGQEEARRMDQERYEKIKGMVEAVEIKGQKSSQATTEDKVDRIVAHKWLGIPIFAAVIYLVFALSQTWLGPWLADIFVGWIETFYAYVDGLVGTGVNPVLRALLLDGIIGGVGAVVGFLPLIMVLFFFLALLEDSGYMARVAVIMDRFFKKIGLSGKSIIPMIISTGCAIPGIMATRTIKDPTQRRATAMLAPFMPCGAKVPIIALFSGLFFSGQAWVGASMYFLAIFVIALSGLIIKKITGDTSQGAYFIMELPNYRFPSIKRATLSTLSRAKAFIIKAGTIILISNALVQLLQTFNWQGQVVLETAPQTSILATIASPLAILFIPLGFGLWQFAAAAITGFIAKENVVATLAVTFAVTNFIDVEEFELIAGAGEVSNIFGIGALAAFSYLVFNLFTPPCFAAIGAMATEMESRKWLFAGVAFQLGMGYVLSFIIYQGGSLILNGAVAPGFVGGLVAVLLMVALVVYLMVKPKEDQASSSVEKVG